MDPKLELCFLFLFSKQLQFLLLWYKYCYQSHIFAGDEKFWTLPATEADIIQPWKSNWNPPYTYVRALDVETTSYILLAYNKRDDTTNGIKILKWLGRQRNSNGGYISTQVCNFFSMKYVSCKIEQSMCFLLYECTKLVH